MASDGNPVAIPATSLVHGSQAPTTVIVKQPSGNSLPPGGNAAAIPAAGGSSAAKPGAAAVAADIHTQVNLLNKSLNDSGRPDQFRVDPSSDGQRIQQINPATGAVIGEFLASEFPVLARSVGLSGAIINKRA